MKFGEKKKILRLVDFKSLLSLESLLKNFVFILFVSSLAIYYIWNGKKAERDTREIEVLKRDLKEKKSEFTTLKFELDRKSLQSSVANMEAIKSKGLEELREPPKEILIHE